MLVAALLTDPEARVRVAAALHGHAELHCCRRVLDLLSTVAHRHVDGVVVEPWDEMGISTAPTVRRLRRNQPSLPILVCCRLDETTARPIVALARAGADDVIRPDHGDIGLQLRQRFILAGTARAAGQVLSELAPLLPPTVEPIVAY